MSSRFVSAGAIDAATGEAASASSSSSSPLRSSAAAPPKPPPSKRQQEWAEVTAQLEADRRRREEARHAQQAGTAQQAEKSLYEVLQANKAAKQAAFEEAHRLRNQFRALDDDEVEFLDEVRMRKRREEEEARREVERGLAEFRRKAQSAAKAEAEGADDQLDDGEGLGLDVDFAGRRKRRKGEHGRDKKRVKGVGIVKRRESGEEGGTGKDGEGNEDDTVKGEETGTGGGVRTGAHAPGNEDPKSATSNPSPAPAPVTSTAKSAGLLVDYGSDDDD
ncbi:N-terminal domain of NEFA-interacting nuclear protein NIP30-domain-containing protein [Chaetomium strumarium]|uniref:N-terminal domain of NEFA-interacting nuclear protein NIP30-domain-containing protein n=1 Tax=Chaetomium strumarium TaxID=1170767 RepID=A0AAJ0GVV6_9PEZI|nr:N-terminal domain of NEFA-interacting nuclear protein NIP30-domain-containing protein [Chaetomium strumarium]